MPKYTKDEVAEARAALLEMLKPGDTVYTILRHVSQSGMQREISMYVMQPDDREPSGTRLQWIDGYARKVLGMRLGKREGLVVGGCGMDMGFHLVYNLSYALFGKGWTCVGERCPSNDHSNGDRNRKPHPHSDGCYALSHRWL